MNQFRGKIIDIKNHLGILIVTIEISKKIVFTSVIINTDEQNSFVDIQDEVTVFFKETEVIICRNENIEISIQNKVPCTIKYIEIGEILCHLILCNNEIEFQSILTKNAFEQMKLNQGDSVIGLIQPTEISLSND